MTEHRSKHETPVRGSARSGETWSGILVVVGAAIILLAFVAPKVFASLFSAAAASVHITPDCPVDFKWREAIFQGKVMIIQNTTAVVLVNVVAVCQKGNKSDKKTINLGNMTAGQVIDIGWTDGWAFSTGDTLSINADGYSAVARVMP